MISKVIIKSLVSWCWTLSLWRHASGIVFSRKFNYATMCSVPIRHQAFQLLKTHRRENVWCRDSFAYLYKSRKWGKVETCGIGNAIWNCFLAVHIFCRLVRCCCIRLSIGRRILFSTRTGEKQQHVCFDVEKYQTKWNWSMVRRSSWTYWVEWRTNLRLMDSSVGSKKIGSQTPTSWSVGKITIWTTVERNDVFNISR